MSRKGQAASMEYAYLLNPGDMRAALGQGDIANYRVRTIRSGDQVEVEAYPIHRPGSNSIRRRREAESCTSEAQAEVNRRNAERKITRLLNANFTRHDISMTWTYETAPGSIEAAQKELTNGINRLRRLFKRLQAAGKIDAESEFKYLYVSEYATREGEPVRVHHHIVCNIPDRDAAEACWKRGRANADRLQPDRYGFTALGKYLSKAPTHKRRWAGSRNLKQPTITVADRKLSKRRAMALIDDVEANAYEIFTKLYPDCEYLDCTVRVSEWMQGGYIYARMRKIA